VKNEMNKQNDDVEKMVRLNEAKLVYVSQSLVVSENHFRRVECLDLLLNGRDDLPEC